MQCFVSIHLLEMNVICMWPDPSIHFPPLIRGWVAVAAGCFPGILFTSPLLGHPKAHPGWLGHVIPSANPGPTQLNRIDFGWISRHWVQCPWMNFITELFIVSCNKQHRKIISNWKWCVLICHISFQPYPKGDYLSTMGMTQLIYSSTYFTLGLGGNKFKKLWSA